MSLGTTWQNFVDSDTGGIIQSIQSMWSQCIQIMKREQNYELQSI